MPSNGAHGLLFVVAFLGIIGSAQESASSRTSNEQVPTATEHQKYTLTVVQSASSAKRLKKNRVSAQAVIKVTDENDVPVAGIAVTFTIPQFVSGGASFASGGLTSIVTTNAAGLASSTSFVTGASSSFSMTAAASVPGGAISATIPVNTAAALAAGAAFIGIDQACTCTSPPTA